MKKVLGLILVTASLPVFATALPMSPATKAINALGIDLLRATSSTNDNALLSPYSIQSALAIAYAGAAGVTHQEMQEALHYPNDAVALHGSLADLRKQLSDAVRLSNAADTSAPAMILDSANRLYVRRGSPFKTNFLNLVSSNYDASVIPVDFKTAGPQTAQAINEWIAQTTHHRLTDVIDPTALDASTRMVLINALYFKATWSHAFQIEQTHPAPFYIHGGKPADVPTMTQQAQLGHAIFKGGQAVALNYRGEELQLLILLPDRTDGLDDLRPLITPELLQQCANLNTSDVILHLPRFTFQPPTLALADALRHLGMKTAFDPSGSADFSEMTPPSDDYLYISKALHKTFVAVDETGTEAAAVTTLEFVTNGARIGPPPIHVNVDHPFLFAIQHRPSGACLFLGQVVDPRSR